MERSFRPLNQVILAVLVGAAALALWPAFVHSQPMPSMVADCTDPRHAKILSENELRRLKLEHKRDMLEKRLKWVREKQKKHDLTPPVIAVVECNVNELTEDPRIDTANNKIVGVRIFVGASQLASIDLEAVQ